MVELNMKLPNLTKTGIILLSSVTLLSACGNNTSSNSKKEEVTRSTSKSSNSDKKREIDEYNDTEIWNKDYIIKHLKNSDDKSYEKPANIDQYVGNYIYEREWPENPNYTIVYNFVIHKDGTYDYGQYLMYPEDSHASVYITSNNEIKQAKFKLASDESLATMNNFKTTGVISTKNGNLSFGFISLPNSSFSLSFDNNGKLISLPTNTTFLKNKNIYWSSTSTIGSYFKLYDGKVIYDNTMDSNVSTTFEVPKVSEVPELLITDSFTDITTANEKLTRKDSFFDNTNDFYQYISTLDTSYKPTSQNDYNTISFEVLKDSNMRKGYLEDNTEVVPLAVLKYSRNNGFYYYAYDKDHYYATNKVNVGDTSPLAWLIQWDRTSK